MQETDNDLLFESVLYDFDNGTFDINLRNDYKSRKTNRRFRTGHRYINMKKRDRILYNKDAQVFLNLDFGLPDSINKLFQERGLFLSPSIEERTTQNPDRLFTNVRQFARTNPEDLSYSMNKKRRWLLPDMLQEIIREHPVIKKTTSVKSHDTKDDNPFRIKLYKYNKALFFSKKTHTQITYMDNNGKNFFKKWFNGQSLFPNFWRISRRRRAERKKSRKGNKWPRSSKGMSNYRAKKHTIAMRKNTDEQLDDDSFLPSASYHFWMPHKTFTESRCWQSSPKAVPQKVRCHRRLLEHNIYGTKFKRENYFQKNHILRALMQIEKHKKVARLYELIRDEIDISDLDISPIIVKNNAQEIIESQISTTVKLSSYFESNCSSLPSLRVSRTRLVVQEEPKQRKIIYLTQKSSETGIDTKADSFTVKKEEETLLPATGTYLEVSFRINHYNEFIGSLEALLVDDSSSLVKTSVTNSDPVKLLLKIDNLIYHKLNQGDVASSYLKSIQLEETATYLCLNLNALSTRKPAYSMIINTNTAQSDTLVLQQILLNNDDHIVDSVSELIDFYADKIASYVENFWSSKDSELRSGEKTFEVLKLSQIESIFSSISFTDIVSLYKLYAKDLHEVSLKISVINSNLSKEEAEANAVIICSICYDEIEWPYSNFLSLKPCGHGACIACWQNYFKVKIENIKVTMSFAQQNDNSSLVKQLACIHDKCDTKVGLDLICSLVPVELAFKYVKFYTDLKILRERNFAYCRNSRCKKMISTKRGSEALNDIVSKCQCGYSVCNFCLQESHFPASCTQAKRYAEELQELEKMNIRDLGECYTSEGHNCPNCGNYMEKNEGCNHMSCVCGFQFCWLCLKDYYKYHSASNGYFCAYEKKTVVKHDSSKFIGYNSKFRNSRKELVAIMIDERRKRLSSSYKVTLDKQFDALYFKVIKSFTKLAKYPLSSLEYNQIRTQVATIKDNMYKMHYVNEFLALLVSGGGGILLKTSSSTCSIRYNLIRTLKKSINLCNTINEIISSCAYNGDVFKRLQFLDNQLLIIVRNIRHSIVDHLKIYELKS